MLGSVRLGSAGLLRGELRPGRHWSGHPGAPPVGGSRLPHSAPRTGGTGGAAAGTPAPAEGSRGQLRPLAGACGRGETVVDPERDRLPAAVCLSSSGSSKGQAGQGPAGTGRQSREVPGLGKGEAFRRRVSTRLCGSGSARCLLAWSLLAVQTAFPSPLFTAAGEAPVVWQAFVTGPLHLGPFLRPCPCAVMEQEMNMQAHEVCEEDEDGCEEVSRGRSLSLLGR